MVGSGVAEDDLRKEIEILTTSESRLREEVDGLKRSLASTKKELDTMNGTESRLRVYQDIMSSFWKIGDCSQLEGHFEQITKLVPAVGLRVAPAVIEYIANLGVPNFGGGTFERVCHILRCTEIVWDDFNMFESLSYLIGRASSEQQRVAVAGVFVGVSNLVSDIMSFERSLFILQAIRVV